MLDVLFVPSHVDYLTSMEMFFGCLPDIGLGIWGLCLRDVELDQDGLHEIYIIGCHDLFLLLYTNFDTNWE